MSEKIQIVFDCSAGGSDGGRFVETEDMEGYGVGVGEWVERPDGLWALVIDVASGIRRDHRPPKGPN